MRRINRNPGKAITRTEKMRRKIVVSTLQKINEGNNSLVEEDMATYEKPQKKFRL